MSPVHSSEAFVNVLMLLHSHATLCIMQLQTLEVHTYVKVTSCVALMHCISGFLCHNSSVLEALLLLSFAKQKRNTKL